MITSKLTTRARTTIPQRIRAALGLEPGDELAYEVCGQVVLLSRARSSGGRNDPFSAFSEWNSAADRKAYGDL